MNLGTMGIAWLAVALVAAGLVGWRLRTVRRALGVVDALERSPRARRARQRQSAKRGAWMMYGHTVRPLGPPGRWLPARLKR